MQVGRVYWPFGRQSLKFLRSETAVARDFRQHLFWRHAWKLADGGGNFGSEGKDGVVNCQQIDDVARNAAVRRRRRFVGGEIDGMQHLSEKRVGLCREEPESRVGDPFQRHRVLAARDQGVALSLAHTPPLDLETSRHEGCRVGCSRPFEAVL